MINIKNGFKRSNNDRTLLVVRESDRQMYLLPGGGKPKNFELDFSGKDFLTVYFYRGPGDSDHNSGQDYKVEYDCFKIGDEDKEHEYIKVIPNNVVDHIKKKKDGSRKKKIVLNDTPIGWRVEIEAPLKGGAQANVEIGDDNQDASYDQAEYREQ